MSNCAHCGEDKELRPYGPRGECICFNCAFSTPDRKAQTEAAYTQQINACGDAAMIGTDAGPVPYAGKKQ